MDEKRTQAEIFEHRRAVAGLLCLLFFFGICLWESVGWHFRYVKLLEVPAELSEEESDAGATKTRTFYYDKQAHVLFSVTVGKEPLFYWKFDDNTVWSPLHSIRRTDYVQRYWYEHLSELCGAFSGLDYELELDDSIRSLFSATVHIPETDSELADRAFRSLRASLSSLSLSSDNRFVRYASDFRSFVEIIFDNLDRSNETVRLNSG